MKSKRRCDREHHFAYTLGIRTRDEAAPLTFGTFIHKGIEAFLTGEPFVGTLDDPYENERAHAMLDGYRLRWADDEYVAIAVEVPFDTELVNPATGHASLTYRLGGKLDAVMRHQVTLDEWIQEHKTSSEDITPGSTYWAKLRLDAQVSTYMVGARSLGFTPRGVLYDVLKKPQQRPSQIPLLDLDGMKIVLDAQGQRVRTKDGKKWRESADSAQGYVLQTRVETPEEYGARIREDIAENPNAYYQREPVVRLEEEEKEAAADTWQIAARIRESRRTGIAPRNPDACSRFGRMCSYWPVCSGETTLENPERYVKVERVHAELEEAAQ